MCFYAGVREGVGTKGGCKERVGEGWRGREEELGEREGQGDGGVEGEGEGKEEVSGEWEGAGERKSRGRGEVKQ